MKVLVIPDVHLKPWMFHKAEILMEQGIAERAVCLMDIPDDWGQEFNIDLYEETYDAAIEFAVRYPDTLWTYGNHDLCYLWNKRESGYSPLAVRTVCEKLTELQHALPEDNLIRYVHRIDNVLFCHGGLLDRFVLESVPSSKYNDIDEILDIINGMSGVFIWNDLSPIWHRPQYSAGKMYKPKKLLQVVGHTPVEKIYREGNVISCDVFSTYSDGTPIGTQEYLLLDTITWEFEGIR